MKIYTPGFPTVDTDTGEVTATTSRPQTEVLQFTRTKSTGSPLVNGDAPAPTQVPHSITDKPEVSK